MPTDVMQGWQDFFVAEARASAALAGLLFVAISINLTRILEYRHWPSRAVEALLALLSVLVIATFALVPAQSAEPAWLSGQSKPPPSPAHGKTPTRAPKARREFSPTSYRRCHLSLREHCLPQAIPLLFTGSCGECYFRSPPAYSVPGSC